MIYGIYHVNINCSNLEKSKWFYEQFGFRKMMNLKNPNPEKAQEELYQALGMPRNSDCDGYMLFCGDSEKRCRIDLLQWDVMEGYPQEAPPKHAQCLGFQRICLHTDDFEAELARLHEVGIDPAYTVCNEPYLGSTMKIAGFRDPDGTLIELNWLNMNDDKSVNSMYRLPRNK